MSRSLRAYGPEPTFDKPVESRRDPALFKAIRFYDDYVKTGKRMSARREEMFEWLVEWMRESKLFEKEEWNVLRPKSVTIDTMAMARMISNGCPFSKDVVAGVVDTVKKAVDAVNEMKEKHDQFSRPKADVQALTKAAKSRLIAMMEGAMDDFLVDGAEFSSFYYLTTNAVKPTIARSILEKYKPVLEEYELALSGKDKELTEAYEVSRPDSGINKMAVWLRVQLEETERYCALDSGRSPRKKKEKSAAKLVSRLRYMRESESFKLTSVDPTHIVGAGSLWVFNTKNRRLTEYSSLNGGLTVNGSSIENYDPASSQTKTLRKPQEVLTELLVVSRGNAGKIMPSLKTTKYEPNGRINEDTILVRVFR